MSDKPSALARPPQMVRRVTLRLPARLVTAINRVAVAEANTSSAVVRRLLAAALLGRGPARDAAGARETR